MCGRADGPQRREAAGAGKRAVARTATIAVQVGDARSPGDAFQVIRNEPRRGRRSNGRGDDRRHERSRVTAAACALREQTADANFVSDPGNLLLATRSRNSANSFSHQRVRTSSPPAPPTGSPSHVYMHVHGHPTAEQCHTQDALVVVSAICTALWGLLLVLWSVAVFHRCSRSNRGPLQLVMFLVPFFHLGDAIWQCAAAHCVELPPTAWSCRPLRGAAAHCVALHLL